jgi:hypothetical protein
MGDFNANAQPINNEQTPCRISKKKRKTLHERKTLEINAIGAIHELISKTPDQCGYYQYQRYKYHTQYFKTTSVNFYRGFHIG